MFKLYYYKKYNCYDNTKEFRLIRIIICNDYLIISNHLIVI